LVAFLDADDVWLPEKLAAQVTVLGERPEVGLCHTEFDIIDGNGLRTGAGFEGRSRDYLELLTGCGICVSTVLVRRSCLFESGLFDPLIPAVADYDLWLKIARRHSVHKCAGVLAGYRMHGSNMSRDYRRMFQGQRSILQRHLMLARRAGDRAAIRAASYGIRQTSYLYGTQAFDQLCECVRARRIWAGVRHFAWALRLAPQYSIRSIVEHRIRRLGRALLTAR
jgi:hypothetical protein